MKFLIHLPLVLALSFSCWVVTEGTGLAAVSNHSSTETSVESSSSSNFTVNTSGVWKDGFIGGIGFAAAFVVAFIIAILFALYYRKQVSKPALNERSPLVGS